MYIIDDHTYLKFLISLKKTNNNGLGAIPLFYSPERRYANAKNRRRRETRASQMIRQTRASPMSLARVRRSLKNGVRTCGVTVNRFKRAQKPTQDRQTRLSMARLRRDSPISMARLRRGPPIAARQTRGLSLARVRQQPMAAREARRLSLARVRRDEMMGKKARRLSLARL